MQGVALFIVDDFPADGRGEEGERKRNEGGREWKGRGGGGGGGEREK
jgi:hypothetical protein